VSVPLVIGIGNPDRGDDAAGPLVADAVTSLRPDIDVVRLSDPLALVDLLAGRHLVIVVDAALTGRPPGTVGVLDVSDSPLPGERRGSTTSSHGLSLGDAIELARALGRLPDRLLVVVVEGDAVELGQAPQPIVLASVTEATTQVLAMVDGGIGDR